MKKIQRFKFFIIVVCCVSIVGCASIPKGFLKPSKDAFKNRQLQTRQYDSTNEEKIITSVAGVLQDLGFTLDSSETKLGLVSASKKADATHGGQIAGAFILDVLSAVGGVYSNNSALCDKVQKIKASVIIKPSLNGQKIVVRVTFQRIVWNMRDQVSKIETINDPKIYEKFYSGLSKSIFLEAQEI